MDLPEDIPTSFAKFVDWLYTGQLECAKCEANANNGGGTFRYADVQHDMCWVGLWVFADKIGLADLAKLALEQFGACLWHGYKGFSAEAVCYVYKSTAENSPLRKELVENARLRYYGYLCGPDGADDEEELAALGKVAASNEDFNRDFLKEVKQHMEVSGKDCKYYMCSIHHQPHLCDVCSETLGDGQQGERGAW